MRAAVERGYSSEGARPLVPLALAVLSYAAAVEMGMNGFVAAFVGALVGFLWWNAPKANVFMGDVGSMAIGGVIAAMSILSRTEVLGVLIAGAFIIGPGSVILQRLYFRLTRGKRMFLMSPFHHHLEMRGWSEGAIEMFGLLFNQEALMNSSFLEMLREEVGSFYTDLEYIVGGTDLLPRAFVPELAPRIRFGAKMVVLEQTDREVTVHYRTAAGRF